MRNWEHINIINSEALRNFKASSLTKYVQRFNLGLGISKQIIKHLKILLEWVV